MSVRRTYGQEARGPSSGWTAGKRIRPLWSWLICGILLCQLAGTAAWSRYRDISDGGGSAVIACLVSGTEFRIDAGSLPTRPGETTQVAFEVTNYEGIHVSETLLQYTVEPETAENLPLIFYLKRDETKGAADTEWIPEGSIAGNHASQAGLLQAGIKTTHRYILTVGWPVETGTGDYEYADEIDYVQIRVHANQVSPK